MKKTSLYIASIGLAAVALGACDNEFERPPMVLPTSDWTANTTIEDFKAEYWSTVDGTPQVVGLNADGDSIILKGRVCSSDQSGNIFKYLYIQGKEEALAISLDMKNIYEGYKYGQEVYINVTGLTVGGYGGMMCLGQGVDDRGRVARAPEAFFKPHAQPEGLPLVALVDTVTATISELDQAKNTEGMQLWQSRLIRIENVHFENAGEEFAPEGSPNNAAERYIVDESGKRIMVRNSTYSDFKADIMPSGNGTVVGILGYFSPNWQISLIDRAGCMDFNGVAAPVFTPGAGTVKPGTAVSIACPTEGAVIHYTLDGTDPTITSTVYSEPIVLTEDITIKAIATKDGLDASSIATARYIVSDKVVTVEEGDGTAAKPYNASQARAKAIENGESSTDKVYVKGYIVSGSINMTYGTGTWVIANNPEGSGDTFELFGTYNTDNGKFTDENAVKVGDLVVAVGPIYNYNGKTPEMSKGHLVSINDEGGDTPTPPAGDAIFSETFLNGSLGDFKATVETSGSWTGWRANTKEPLCALANSYVNGTNEAATAWLVSPEISLASVKEAKIRFEQAFGFYFPTEQGDKCTVNVREKGTDDWTTLKLTVFPEKGTGNWTGWVENTLDISAFAGKTIEIGFKYVNDGAGSVAWEIRNLTVE